MKQIKLMINGKDLLVDVYSKDNKEMVAITPICQAIGIMPHKQVERLEKIEQFNPTHMGGIRSNGREHDMVFLPVEEVGIWGFTHNNSKTHPRTL